MGGSIRGSIWKVSEEVESQSLSSPFTKLPSLACELFTSSTAPFHKGFPHFSLPLASMSCPGCVSFLIYWWFHCSVSVLPTALWDSQQRRVIPTEVLGSMQRISAWLLRPRKQKSHPPHFIIIVSSRQWNKRNTCRVVNAMSSCINWLPKQYCVFFYLWWDTVDVKKIVCNRKTKYSNVP